MSRKTKRRTARARPRPAAVPVQTAGGVATAPSRQQPVRVGGDQTLVRSIEMSLGARQPVGRKAGRLVSDSVDPAIPIARVPHFVEDLRRLAIVAAIMVVLLVAAALVVIPQLIK